MSRTKGNKQNPKGSLSFSQDCSLLYGSLALELLEALLIGVHCKKRYLNV